MTDEFPLYEQSRCWDGGGEIPEKRGVLAIFLKEGEEHEQAVPEDWRAKLICNNRLLYIGGSDDLRRRLKEHFSDDNIDNSTFQHSICAMLCSPIDESARGRCCLPGEKPISSWIQAHCTFAYEVDERKEKLIMLFKPPLNSSGNPCKHPLLTDARGECKTLAKMAKYGGEYDR